MTYNFNQQLTRSKPHEAVLDKYLEDYFFIRLANMTEERQGIDRIMRLRNPFLKVEYKCDSRADTTKNAFIETKSVIYGERTLAPGWAFSTTADLVIYYLTGSKTAYLIDPPKLRDILPTWVKQFPSRRVSTRSSNSHYETEGLLVPLFVLNNLFTKFTFPHSS
jgi:hypothetical protein